MAGTYDGKTGDTLAWGCFEAGGPFSPLKFNRCVTGDASAEQRRWRRGFGLLMRRHLLTPAVPASPSAPATLSSLSSSAASATRASAAELWRLRAVQRLPAATLRSDAAARPGPRPPRSLTASLVERERTGSHGALDVCALAHAFLSRCSDLHTAKGEWGPPALPCVPGHELVGTVTSVWPRGVRVGPPPTDAESHPHPRWAPAFPSSRWATRWALAAVRGAAARAHTRAAATRAATTLVRLLSFSLTPPPAQW